MAQLINSVSLNGVKRDVTLSREDEFIVVRNVRGETVTRFEVDNLRHRRALVEAADTVFGRMNDYLGTSEDVKSIVAILSMMVSASQPED